MKTLLEGDKAVEDYKNSKKGVRNAENERYSVPVGTFTFGKFRKVEEEINKEKTTYYVYPLLRGGKEIGVAAPSQIEKTALWDFSQSIMKKRDEEKYFLIPMAMNPLLEVDKVSLEGKTVKVTISKEIGYKVPFVGTNGYHDRDTAEEAWINRTAKRVYDMVIS